MTKTAQANTSGDAGVRGYTRRLRGGGRQLEIRQVAAGQGAVVNTWLLVTWANNIWASGFVATNNIDPTPNEIFQISTEILLDLLTAHTSTSPQRPFSGAYLLPLPISSPTQLDAHQLNL